MVISRLYFTEISEVQKPSSERIKEALFKVTEQAESKWRQRQGEELICLHKILNTPEGEEI